MCWNAVIRSVYGLDRRSGATARRSGGTTPGSAQQVVTVKPSRNGERATGAANLVEGTASIKGPGSVAIGLVLIAVGLVLGRVALYRVVEVSKGAERDPKVLDIHKTADRVGLEVPPKFCRCILCFCRSGCSFDRQSLTTFHWVLPLEARHYGPDHRFRCDRFSRSMPAAATS